MNLPIISICHATARTAGWQAAWTVWQKNHSGAYPYEYILCMDEAQAEHLPQFSCEHHRTAINRGRPCATDAFNVAASLAAGRILFLAADDCFPPFGWDRLLVNAAALAPGGLDGDFAIWVSTGGANDRDLILVPILSRTRFLKYGYALHPGYPAVYADNEFTAVARRDGVIVDMRGQLRFEHRHFTQANGLPFDEVYARQNHPERYRQGRELFARRSALGFPASVSGGVA